MGKKNKEGLGRSLVKSRKGANRGKKTVEDGNMLHTTAVPDGYDWGRLNLQSVTEESSFQEFLSTAELANTEFQAEKLNLKLVALNATADIGMSAEMRAKAEQKHVNAKHLLRVPRRPAWSAEMSANELQDNERKSFLDWRRDLALLQDRDNFIMTPYEKNLEFWRQLWRVLERSHILVQVVDARNPLMFRCEDLEQYAKEVGVKEMMLLLNKSDLLSETQRRMWAEYFDQHEIKVAFYSAALSAEKNKLDEEIPEEDENATEESDDDESESEEDLNDIEKFTKACEKLEKSVEESSVKLRNVIADLSEMVVAETSSKLSESKPEFIYKWTDKNNPKILTREELLDLFRSVQIDYEDRLCIGMVGYPNVGKSSTINSLMCAKKVSVSATPGKTKHFQTLQLEEDLMLCDCPGLVLPSFVCTKADMIVNGILPIDNMREYIEPVGIVIESIGGREQAERRLGILLPPAPGDNPTALPTRDLLNAYAYSRGMMTGMGQPDCARAARTILKAATNGSLPLAICPPGFDKSEYMSTLYPLLPELPVGKEPPQRRKMTPREARALKMDVSHDDIDRKFFGGGSFAPHVKGVHGKFHGLPFDRMVNASGESVEVTGKPWKQFNKHVNKNKKQKLRKTYYYLDQH